MRRILIPLFTPALLLASCCTTPADDGWQDGFAWDYPTTATVDQVDDYFGQAVSDPYRWLEDDLSDETAAWVSSQNELTFDYLRALPAREALMSRLTQLWNYEKIGVPSRHGKVWVWSKNDGLQNQSVLFVGDKPHDPNARILLDPNTLSADGTQALSAVSFSHDGDYMAYAIADAGSDWQTWFVRDVATGQDRSDVLHWLKNSDVSWKKDSSGFFYSRFPAPEGSELSAVNRDNKMYFHQLGTDQESDTLIHERPDQPDWGFDPTVTDDGRFLVLFGYEGTARKNRMWYMDLESDSAQVMPLFTAFDAAYHYLGNDGTTWFIQTTKDAPRGRVLAIDINNPEPANWLEVIPQTSDVIESVDFLNGSLLVTYLHNAHGLVKALSTSGEHLWDLELPTLGSVGGFSGSHDDDQAYFSFSSFSYPSSVFHLDMTSGKTTLFRSPEVDFDPSGFVADQVWYPSKDGTQVPMFLVRKKGVEPNGELPVLLYGYGGFNIPLTPYFSIANTVWMEMGGVYAMANIRGGGEFGQEWHQGGTVLNKQNVFDDFIAAAEWLIENDWTKPSRLAIRGGSNGGLLVGACMTQRPELFGACLPAVGVLDMLRYHKFTIGWAWASDYGTSDDEDQFNYLIQYSPVHNVNKGVDYPATLVTTGDHDDRVVPAHSFKFAAALQAAQAGDDPVLIRIETRAGHGAGKPTAKRIEEYADTWAFLVEALEMETPQF
ncbi:MAG: S9 family peptidase [Planctomycetes bacterium]|jgi:prolyl oligopeptidase|nr:S9 family peptidase [Planctomycetota bacterium]MBT7011269.1 S9 family peptidase [Planctomycetota bacterium]MBT7319141.1 S9 family peptidase [Planctomycetota bacterium]